MLRTFGRWARIVAWFCAGHGFLRDSMARLSEWLEAGREHVNALHRGSQHDEMAPISFQGDSKAGMLTPHALVERGVLSLTIKNMVCT